jgi:hypothetical protein
LPPLIEFSFTYKPEPFEHIGTPEKHLWEKGFFKMARLDLQLPEFSVGSGNDSQKEKIHSSTGRFSA